MSRVAQIRAASGLSQERFGRRLGVTQSAISLLERQDAPPPSGQLAARIHRTFEPEMQQAGVTLADLLQSVEAA